MPSMEAKDTGRAMELKLKLRRMISLSLMKKKPGLRLLQPLWNSIQSQEWGTPVLQSFNGAVTELMEGDWSRKVIELICRRSSSEFRHKRRHIDKIFKVQNMPKTLSRFEEHRQMVKNKGSKLHEKNPRCMVDGNELLGFYGSILACSLDVHGSSILCNSDRCGVCQILRHGFEQKEGKDGVFIYAATGRAFESIVLNEEEEEKGQKRVLMVCRVIAGRVCSGAPKEDEVKACFDSLAIKMGKDSKFEELRVLNFRAVLPCFLVTYKQNNHRREI